MSEQTGNPADIAQAQTQSQGAQQPAVQQQGAQSAVQPLTDEWQFRLNRWLIWFLGVGLLAVVGGILYLSIDKRPLPDTLTSLASLIGGGLLAFLNPVGGVSKRNGSSNNS